MKTIDIWWQYDDCGLTVLTTYLLTLRAVEGVQAALETLDINDQNNLAHRVTKLRIDFEFVTVSKGGEHGRRDSDKPLVQLHEDKVLEQVLMRPTILCSACRTTNSHQVRRRV